MSNAQLIRKINRSFGAVYEMGDAALDVLTDQPNYRKWLDAGHGDDYLAKLDKVELTALLEDIQSVVEDYAW